VPDFGRWADVLRLIGRHVDAQEPAEDVAVVSSEEIQVRWRQLEGHKRAESLSGLDLNRLRETAPLMRRPISTPSRGDREELMRTLGQELDALGIEVDEISERPGGFEVRGRGPDVPDYRFYAASELRQLSEERRKLRKDTAGERATGEPLPGG
jgi:hypothetical protein